MLYVREARGSVAEVCKKVEAATVANKFGVLGTLDLKAKMNEKGVAFERECRVVEVCQPLQAKAVLEASMKISTVLPCRISAYEDQGKVMVATVKPVALLVMFGTAAVLPVAQEVEKVLTRIIDAACA